VLRKTDPTDAADDLVQEIVELLAAKMTQNVQIHENRAAIEEDVKATISTLRQIIGKPKLWNPLWGNQRQNLEYLGTLRARIDRLERTLKAVPDGLVLGLFIPEGSPVLDALVNTGDPGERLIDALGDEAEAHWEQLAIGLGNLRARCDQLASIKPGEHASAGYRQKECAKAARELMERWGKSVTYSSPQSPFSIIACSLYTALTGERAHDMRRACKAMLRVSLRS
jgi:hypothetical protein